MSRSRTFTSLRYQLREYRARAFPLTLVALLPLVFWAATFFSLSGEAGPVTAAQLERYTGSLIGRVDVTEVSERDTWPFDTALMGVGWAVAAAALFSVIGSGPRDRRLVLAGYRPWEILVARLAILVLIGLAVSTLPPLLVAGFADTPPANIGLVWLGSLFFALVGASIGLIVGSLLPRPLEGTIVLIGLVGVEVSIPLTLAVRQYLPFFGPQALYLAGRLAAEPVVLVHVVRGLAWSVGLALAAIAIWSWKVRVHAPATAPREDRRPSREEQGATSR